MKEALLLDRESSPMCGSPWRFKISLAPPTSCVCALVSLWSKSSSAVGNSQPRAVNNCWRRLGVLCPRLYFNYCYVAGNTRESRSDSWPTVPAFLNRLRFHSFEKNEVTKQLNAPASKHIKSHKARREMIASQVMQANTCRSLVCFLYVLDRILCVSTIRVLLCTYGRAVYGI